MFLILIDAHSKWVEAFCVTSATSSVTIECLRQVFAQFGIPETVVTDNGTCFVSAEFESFLKANGVKHLTSAPYHPASNGLAERAVQIVKQGLKKVTQGSLNARLAKILFAYRLTPQSTTGISPSELLLGRRPRSRLDLVRPNTAERVEAKQLQQKVHHDTSARARQFNVGDTVWVKNFSKGDTWLPGRITKRLSAVSFLIQGQSSQSFRRHQDDIQHRPDDDGDADIAVLPSTESTIVDPSESPESLVVGPSQAISDESQPPEAQPPDNNPPLSTTPRYPPRNRSAPDRYRP